MLSAVKKILPAEVKKPVRQMIKVVKYTSRKARLKNALKDDSKNFKIIVGAAETYQEGWYSTNEQWLDIANKAHWQDIFKGRACLTHVVAEHVFEHLTPDQALTALQMIHAHLLPKGRIRIAVPDGYHPEPVYLKHVGIQGIGDDAADHKQLLTVDTLSDLLHQAGYETRHIEGFTKKGTLIKEAHSLEEGYIYRSRQNNHDESRWAFPDADTSLIVDGVKQG